MKQANILPPGYLLGLSTKIIFRCCCRVEYVGSLEAVGAIARCAPNERSAIGLEAIGNRAKS